LTPGVYGRLAAGVLDVAVLWRKHHKKHGFDESKASIANKLARATMSAHFSWRHWHQWDVSR
jgi:hypothetical protein